MKLSTFLVRFPLSALRGKFRNSWSILSTPILVIRSVRTLTTSLPNDWKDNSWEFTRDRLPETWLRHQTWNSKLTPVRERVRDDLGPHPLSSHHSRVLVRLRLSPLTIGRAQPSPAQGGQDDRGELPAERVRPNAGERRGERLRERYAVRGFTSNQKRTSAEKRRVEWRGGERG